MTASMSKYDDAMFRPYSSASHIFSLGPSRRGRDLKDSIQ